MAGDLGVSTRIADKIGDIYNKKKKPRPSYAKGETFKEYSKRVGLASDRTVKREYDSYKIKKGHARLKKLQLDAVKRAPASKSKAKLAVARKTKPTSAKAKFEATKLNKRVKLMDERAELMARLKAVPKDSTKVFVGGKDVTKNNPHGKKALDKWAKESAARQALAKKKEDARKKKRTKNIGVFGG